MKQRCGLMDQILSPHFHHTRPAAHTQGFQPAPAPPRKSSLRVAPPLWAAGPTGRGGTGAARTDL